jgi:hypothetical protein
MHAALHIYSHRHERASRRRNLERESSPSGDVCASRSLPRRSASRNTRPAKNPADGYVTRDSRRCPRSGWTLSLSVGSRRTSEPSTGGGRDPPRPGGAAPGRRPSPAPAAAQATLTPSAATVAASGHPGRGLNGSCHSVQAGGAAYGIRTRDLRITRAPRKCSWRSTSTDSTPHSSQATEGSRRSTFRVPRPVPRRRGSRFNPCHRCRCRSRRRRPHRPEAGWPVTADAGRAGAGGVSAAAGGVEVRRVPALHARPSRRIMCLTLSRMTYPRGNLHRTGLVACRGGRREHERSSRS